MKDKRLKAELWEIQVILYGILDVLLWDRLHWLAIAILIWIIITIIGTFRLLIQVYLEQQKDKGNLK